MELASIRMRHAVWAGDGRRLRALHASTCAGSIDVGKARFEVDPMGAGALRFENGPEEGESPGPFSRPRPVVSGRKLDSRSPGRASPLYGRALL